MKKKTSPFIFLAILGVCLCGACAFFILRPVPDLDYLYNGNYPELKGKLPESIIGTRVQVFLDPSLYYKFDASEADAIQLATLLKLDAVANFDQASQCFKPTGLLWHDLWWHPDPQSASKLFNAYQNGDDVCLIYDFKEKVIYLYIQNT